MSAARVLLALLATLLPGCEAGSARPTVVLVTPESLRADHVGSYGYASASLGRDRMPGRTSAPPRYAPW